ncbi:hypothetical protein GHT06_010286 [Daphnia sinensis]|uniref:Gustatory receptor n=1 Tax=Daphnia sinensis TaxID=1820382 RepID=A0AAD5PWU1_9CRUS|nr:hypothetical protein GHT06_010286 [Daphnia sinensis]
MQASLNPPQGLILVFNTETATLNWIIDFINYGIHAIGTHVILLTAMRPLDLLKSFNRMKLVLAANNYNGVRRISSLGIVYIILVVSGILFLVTDYHLRRRTSFNHHLFVTFISTLSAIYPMTALLLFVVHCYASSLAFELIQMEIERREVQLFNSQHEDVGLFVFAVKQRYFLACDTVDNINYSFGWILLLSTTFYFVAIINSSFYLFGMEVKTATDIAFLLFALVHLILMCSIADHVSNKAGDVIRQLLKFKCADKPFAGNQIEMEFLVTQMAQTIPQISANGYFNVGKKLLPQVVGAALTYFFILCEFKASEQRLPPN